LYDATQGRNGGGNINAILKSGTSKLHFDLFEYFRNTDLNANNFFLKLDNLPRPVITQNIFGVSVGGPIGPKGRLGYFFVNYQGTRQRSATPGHHHQHNHSRASCGPLSCQPGVCVSDPQHRSRGTQAPQYPEQAVW